jgi:hypothetical protein
MPIFFRAAITFWNSRHAAGTNGPGRKKLSGRARSSESTAMRAALAAITVAAALIVCAGCAKIGEPQPPVVYVPRAAADLTARQRADSVVLIVSMPVQNTNGSAVNNLRSIDIYRLAVDAAKNPGLNPFPEEQFEKLSAPVMSIPAARLSGYRSGNSLVIEDKLFLPDKASPYTQVFRYAVLFINTRNQTAGFSNQAVIAPVPLPPPPAGLAAAVTETSIDLKWTPPAQNADGSSPARIAGYMVYRSEEPGKFPAIPITDNPVPGPEFRDKSFQFDKTYYYAVSVVGSIQNPYAESLASEGLAVVAGDVFPPLPPKDFNAVIEGGIVILLWTPSPSSDVVGYRIYRREEGAPSAQPLQSEPIAFLSFRDAGAASNKKYEYSIVAVDAHGNESLAVRTGVDAR